MVTDDNFVVSLSCRDSLAQSGNYAACSDVNLTNRRPLCELRTARDVQTLKSVAKTSGALLVVIFSYCSYLLITYSLL